MLETIHQLQIGHVLFVVAAVLFCLKVLWNLSVPYALAARGSAAKDEATKGISLALELDALLLLLAVGASFLMGRNWPWNPGGVALWGVVILVGCYVHFVLAGMVAGWLSQALRRRLR